MSTLDEMVSKITAFRSWAELVAAMSGGYTPTLPEKGQTARLARVLIAKGWPVWPARKNRKVGR